MAHARVALVTSGGVVPKGNPDHIESSSASKYGEYSIAEFDDLTEATHETAHGGYDPVYANQDPNRVLPVDVLREMEKAGKIGIISCGWDPGMFSIARVYGQAILPEGQDYTFWGRGVSQGHSDAIRRIPGVVDARQYTVPVPEAVEAVGRGENPTLTTRDKHTRECYVVAAEGADREAIREAIVTMPNYFADYNTTVTFITAEEMARDHAGLPHGGEVIRNGRTGIHGLTSHTIRYSLRLESNPEFTASAIVAFARAVYRMKQRGRTGCITVLDVAPADLSQLSPEELRAHML